MLESIGVLALLNEELAEMELAGPVCRLQSYRLAEERDLDVLLRAGDRVDRLHLLRLQGKIRHAQPIVEERVPVDRDPQRDLVAEAVADVHELIGEPIAEVESDVDDEPAPESEAGAVAVSATAAGQPRAVPGNRLINFLQGSWRELQRVQWPDRQQVMQATGVVIGFVIVAGVFLGVADWLAGHLVSFVENGHF